MPDDLVRVTLQGTKEDNYLYKYGVKAFVFVGGVGQRVPIPVAQALRKKMDRMGRPLFQIEERGMPEIVKGKAERRPRRQVAAAQAPSSPRGAAPTPGKKPRQASFLDEEE